MTCDFVLFVSIPIAANEVHLNEVLGDSDVSETIDESEPQMEDVFDAIDLKIRVCAYWILVSVQFSDSACKNRSHYIKSTKCHSLIWIF